MKSIHSVSILGCGWLGLPLAEQLIKEGYKVKGSVTKSEKLPLLKEKKIIPFQIELTGDSVQGKDLDDFLNSDVLLINIPPGRRTDVISHHKAQIQHLIQAIEISNIQQVVFISSSAVYSDLNKEIVETDPAEPQKDSGKALLAAEQLLQSQNNFTTTIIRFCGLIGPDRHPGKFLGGKKNVTNGGAPVNIIHQEDAIALICGVLQHQAWGELFNACADEHPSRKLFYTKAAEQLGLEVPSFIVDEPGYKIIRSDKIKKRLNYSFLHPDPLHALNGLIQT